MSLALLDIFTEEDLQFYCQSGSWFVAADLLLASKHKFIFCIFRNIYVVVVPLKRARGRFRLKSPDDMDLEEVSTMATVAIELKCGCGLHGRLPWRHLGLKRSLSDHRELLTYLNYRKQLL